MDSGAQLASLSSHFIQSATSSHRMALPTFRMCLPSVKPLWKCPQRWTQICLLSDSKSCQFDNDDEASYKPSSAACDITSLPCSSPLGIKASSMICEGKHTRTGTHVLVFVLPVFHSHGLHNEISVELILIHDFPLKFMGFLQFNKNKNTSQTT